MAVRFDATGDWLTRSSGALLDYNAAYTMMGWFYVTTDLNTYSVCMALANGGTYTRYDLLSTDADGVTLRVGDEVGGNTGTALSTGTWYHLAMVRTSVTQLLGYLNGTLDITRNHASVAGATAVGLMEVGNTGGGAGNQFDGRVMAIKYWSRALTGDEVRAEMNALRPLDTTSIYGWWPVFPGSGERTRDYGGAGLNWTENGTLTDEDPAPVSYGASVLVNPYYVIAAGGLLPRTMLMGVG